ncbi:hypothetical protein BJX64DRAFT_285177 [Aspergillus heterothallicus]
MFSSFALLSIFVSLTIAAVDFATLPPHPRLLFTDDRAQYVLSTNTTDSYYGDILSHLATTAQTAVQTPVSLSSASSWSSTIRMNVGAIAGMYRLTKDPTYSDWVIDTLLLLAALPDWDPSNFLNTADITMTASLGYDWVYEVLTDAQRSTIETAISDKAFAPAMNSSINSWSQHTNNWAQVTHGCLIIGTLAVGDVNSTLASEMMSFSLPKLKTSLEQYAPDGGYIEGYSYGAYAGIFLGLMMGAMDTALGDDLGISSLEGMDGLGAWLTYGLGQTGAFSWADGAWTLSNANTLWSVGYWATRFNKPEWLQAMLSTFTTTQSATFQAFLFYNSSLNSPSILPTIPRYAQFAGVAGMTYRTSWTNHTAGAGWFVGFMGGFNGRSHGHLDAGSFVIDYKGHRFAELLGSDSYSLPGYFTGPQRWTYYRCRTEGANTLSISSSSTTQTALAFANQVPSANNSLLWAGSFDESRSRFGVANLTQAYADVATSVLRGVAVVNDSQFVLRDEVVASRPVDIATSWHTSADVAVSSDNRTATLVNGGVTMVATLVSPSDAYFQLVSTNPCEGYTGCAEATNVGISNLAVRLGSMVTEASIVVVLAESGADIGEFDAELADWPSLCTSDCWKGDNVQDPYWLTSSEVYY